MKKHGKMLLKYLIFSVIAVFVMGCFCVSAATKTGFVTQNGKTYYINKDGSRQKGWLELKGKKYYFDKKTGARVNDVSSIIGKQKSYEIQVNKKKNVVITGYIPFRCAGFSALYYSFL